MRVKKKILKLCISVCAFMPAVLPVYVLPVMENIVDLSPVVVDNRAEYIDAYFAKHNLPLAGYGEVFVETADKYDLDYRLLPAIAMRESTGGKFACHSCKTKFASYHESIDKVGAHLAGEIKSTSHYYGNKTVWKKLRTYNSVIAAYPDEIISIMNKIEKGPVYEQGTNLATAKTVATTSVENATTSNLGFSVRSIMEFAFNN